MAKSYDEYEVDQIAKGKKQTDTYSAERKAQADSSVQTSNQMYDAAIANAEKDYNASAKETEKSYRSVYDANAVDELVARRNTEEAMANMGLTNSGLNATQQTAISLQRGRADSQTTQQKQAAVDAIMRELDNKRSQYEAEKTAAAKDIYAQADADILNFKNNVETAARQNAASLYTADQEAASAQAQLAAEQQLKYLEQGYVYNADAGQYEYVGTENSRIAELEAQYDAANAELEAQLRQQELVIDYMKETGASYDEAVKALSGGAAEEQAQKAAAMSDMGTPSYTSIHAQAMSYAKTDAKRAVEYIERQYNAGYITEAQKNSLLQKYGADDGYDYDSIVNRLEYDKLRNSDRIKSFYGTFEAYAAQMIKKAIQYGGMSEEQAMQLIQQYGITEDDLNVVV